MKFTALQEMFKILPRSLRITIIKVIKITLKITRYLNIHGGAAGGHDPGDRIISPGDETGEQIVFVGCQDQFSDCALREDVFGNITCKDIPKIPSWYCKVD